MKRLFASAAIVAIAAIGVPVATAATAHAYGGGAGSFGVFQVGVSFNCDKPSSCGGPDNLGGFWGWLEFDNVTNYSATDLTQTFGTGGDAQLTGCSHGGGFNGAGHTVMHIHDWYIAPDAQNGGLPTFFASWDEIDTFRGQTQPSTHTNESTGIPALSIHRPLLTMFGIPTPPGSSTNVQVAYKPAH